MADDKSEQKTDAGQTDAGRADARETEELREAAKSMGADAEGKDAEEIVEEVAHTQTDSETSPSGWKAERDEE